MPLHVPLTVPDDCVSCMVIVSVGLLAEVIAPVHDPETFRDEPSPEPSPDGSVAVEQADEIPKTIRAKKSLRMPRARQTSGQRSHVKSCVADASRITNPSSAITFLGSLASPVKLSSSLVKNLVLFL